MISLDQGGRSVRWFTIVFVAAASCWAPASMAQQVYPTPGAEDETGFEAIFDGKTLNGWEGDPKYWRVEDGVLVGEVTPETLFGAGLVRRPDHPIKLLGTGEVSGRKFVVKGVAVSASAKAKIEQAGGTIA